MILLLSACVPLNAPADLLHGEWIQPEVPPAEAIRMTLTPDKRITLAQGDQSLTGTYRFDSSQQPFHLDIEWDGMAEDMAAIIGFTDLNTISLEGSDPGAPRPAAFSEDALRLTRVENTVTEAEATPVEPFYGEWIQQDVPAEEAVTMTLTRDNRITLRLGPDSIAGTYRVDTTQDPVHFDIEWEGLGSVATIIALTDADVMLLENNEPGLSRPTTFTDGALRLRRAETAADPAIPAQSVLELDPAARAAAPAGLLRYVPNTLENRRYLTFGDYAAWLDAWGIERPATLDDVDALPAAQRDHWLNALMAQTTPPPDVLGLQYLAVESMVERYGFDFFSADRYLQTGEVPDTITVVAGQYDEAAIGDALTAAGYASAPLAEGVDLFSIRDDYEMDLESPSAIGRLGELNRIALADDLLLVARSTELAEGAVAAAGSSLADDPVYRALLASLDAPELNDAGALVGLVLLGEPVLLDVASLILGDSTPEEIMAQWQAWTEQDPPLPPYLLAGFATYRAPDATYLALHTVYPTAGKAARAAEVLGERLPAYVSLRTRGALPWTLAQSFAADNTAVVVMRLNEADEGPNRLAWINLVFARDLVFLVAE